jgi:hypothetical protein
MMRAHGIVTIAAAVAWAGGCASIWGIREPNETTGDGGDESSGSSSGGGASSSGSPGSEAGPMQSECMPNPCLNGGACNTTDAGKFSCTCGDGYTGATCETASPPRYCDVAYRLDTAPPSAQAGFRVANTGAEATDTTYVVGDNTTAPPGLKTPLTPSAFPRGFMRLRFQDVGGAPAAGPVELIEFFLPAQFTVSAFGTTVATNVQYSTGLLQLATSGCPTANYPECLPSSTTQTLNRVCQSHGSGVLTGTTLTWNACSLMPPAPPPPNPPSIAAWTDDESQIPAAMLPANPGCIEALSVFGVVSCSGNFCIAVPSDALGTQNATYEQKWDSFMFSSTDYATATISMAQSTIPSPTDTYAGIDWAAADPISPITCGPVATLTCDQQ